MFNTKFAMDFETTVYEGQTRTDVWSAAYAELYTDRVGVLNSIDQFFSFIFSLRQNITAWFHNIRFDGSFITDWLLNNGYSFTHEKEPGNKEFTALISRQNRWYNIKINNGHKMIELRDSAKIFPFPLKEVGEAFDTKHKKLEMEYNGYRFPGCEISDKEYAYIINDVLVLKEALEVFLKSGNLQLTIGGNALKYYKKDFSREEWKTLFPDLTDFYIDESVFGVDNAYDFIKKSYRGGYCYLKEGCEGEQIDGMTFDCNSEYSSMMHSMSGNRFPVGKPKFFVGDCPKKDKIYFIRIKCVFYLKEGFIPTVQIKGNIKYKGTEWLKTSDIKVGNKYVNEYYDGEEVVKVKADLYLTCVDYELFLKHYDVKELEVIGGCYFNSAKGLFDGYIDFWMNKKMNAKNKADRTEAKLFLNNLYGKFATNTDSSYMVPYICNETGTLELECVEEYQKVPGYIPIGSMVTSYARNFCIGFAQDNFDNFIYADTDSLHLKRCVPKGIVIDDKKLCCWKLESEWSKGIFIRQKTYAEFVRKENGKKVKPHWEIKCAGMSENVKRKFLATHPITDFKYGLKVGGKLVPVRIPGGTILVEREYTLRKNK